MSEQLAADRMVNTGTRRRKEEKRRVLRAVLDDEGPACAATNFLDEI
jgi:hypothetical protein